MTTVRRFELNDLFRFNNINLDVLTETYNMAFYMQYLAKWPELFVIAESANEQRLMGYNMGKIEGVDENWHGHVTALTISPEYRRLQVAHSLMHYLEEQSERALCYFVDLYVRISNQVAINMYTQMGYTIYRHIRGYYSGTEDAYDMRKSLSRDPEKKSMRRVPGIVEPSEYD